MRHSQTTTLISKQSRNSTLQHGHEERDPDLWRDITHPLQLRRVIRHILHKRVCLMRASHTQPKKTAGHGLPSRNLPSFYPWLLSLLSSPKPCLDSSGFVSIGAHGQARSYSFDLVYVIILCSMVIQPLLHTLSQTEPTTEPWETNSISHAAASDAYLTSIPLTSYACR